jgi:multidrug efflux pump subunit AcrA (membrane-fusion protein)
MFTKRNIIIAVVILVLIGGFFYYRSRSTGEVAQTEKVRRGSVLETVSVTGELVPKIFANLSFQATGTIDTLLAKEGDEARAGQAVASLDSSVLQSQLNEAHVNQSIAEEDEKLARRNGWKKLAPEERDTKKLASEQARKKVQTVIAQINDKTIFAVERWRFSH